jgi:Ankyrin repeats (many copies)
MTLDELWEAIAIDTEHSGVDEGEFLSSPFDIVDMCGNLVVASDITNIVTLAHLSVKEYLLSSSIIETSVRSFAFSEHSGYQTLTAFCLSYLSSTDFCTGPVKTGKAWTHRNTTHPFLEYAARAWPQYAILAEQPDDIVRKINQFFKLESGRSFMSWVQVLNADVSWYDYPRWGQPLYYSASFGLDKVVSLLIQEDSDTVSINKPGSRYGGTALHGAVLRQHTEVMKLLLDAGADPNKVDTIGIPPMHTAAINGNVKVISLLLEHGARVDEYFEGKKPLYWARRYGYQEAVDILLQWEARLQEAGG